MANLRTTVIMLTDIVQSTPLITGLTQVELIALLNSQKQFISDIAVKNEGTIIKGEGDAFWIIFPSVTTATLAAIEMHQDLRATQAGRGEHNRLAIRIVISAGDVLHQDGDIFGLPVVLAARMETITPSDEIYLSHSAWLMLVKAEVSTAFVNEFSLKGFRDPERIYKVEQKQRTRIIQDQYIVFLDVKGWTAYVRTHSVVEVERYMLDYDDIVNNGCARYTGVIRNTGGDSYLLTFSELDSALHAVETFQRDWESRVQRFGLGLCVGVHKGDVNILRSYLFGSDINATVQLSRIAGQISGQGQRCVLVSQKIRDETLGTAWEAHCQKIDKQFVAGDFFQGILAEYGAYQLAASTP